MLRLNKALRSGLAVKLAIYLVVSTGAIFLVFGVLNIRTHRLHAEALLRQDADSISDLILRSTRYHMMRNDRDAIERIVADIGSEPGMTRIRITNRDGTIRYSNNTAEIGTAVGRDASKRLAPRAFPPAASSAQIARPPAGDRELNVERPIFNQPNCATAACHEHPSTQKVLGAIDTHLSLASIDRELAVQQN